MSGVSISRTGGGGGGGGGAEAKSGGGLGIAAGGIHAFQGTFSSILMCSKVMWNST